MHPIIGPRPRCITMFNTHDIPRIIWLEHWISRKLLQLIFIVYSYIQNPHHVILMSLVKFHFVLLKSAFWLGRSHESPGYCPIAIETLVVSGVESQFGRAAKSHLGGCADHLFNNHSGRRVAEHGGVMGNLRFCWGLRVKTVCLITMYVIDYIIYTYIHYLYLFIDLSCSF